MGVVSSSPTIQKFAHPPPLPTKSQVNPIKKIKTLLLAVVIAPVPILF